MVESVSVTPGQVAACVVGGGRWLSVAVERDLQPVGDPPARVLSYSARGGPYIV